ncbi:MAG TPA: hypothetical protein DIW47_04250 [Bacteroidetes bacterium]|nr:hypothetical protein [Bacteroidota bacterium]
MGQLNRLITLVRKKLISLADALIYAFVPAKKKPSLSIDTEAYIAFIGTKLPARITRIGKCIREYKKVLFIQEDGNVTAFLNPEAFDLVLTFRNVWHLLLLLKKNKLPIKLIHAFEPKTMVAARIIRRYKGKIPVTVDFQDVYVNYYGENPPIYWMRKDIPFEKYCIENADGLIASSLELIPAKKLFKVANLPPTIFFPLYCDNSEFSTAISTSTEVNIVYVGGISSFSDTNPDSQITNYHYLINELDSQKIHFHIYPSPHVKKEIISEYQDLSNRLNYFHMHSTVAMSQLSAELSQYDFGIIPFFYNDSWIDNPKLKYSISLKLFNYLEAGLPIIISRDIFFQSWLVKRYDCGIVLSNRQEISTLSTLVKKENASRLKENVLTARHHLSLDAQIPRLLTFYQKIIAAFPQKVNR